MIRVWSGKNVKFFCPTPFSITINGLIDHWYGLEIITDPFSLIFSLGPRYFGIGLDYPRPWARKKELEE